MHLDECEEQFAAVRSARTVDEACEVLRPLFDVYHVLVATMSLPPFWRIRKGAETKWKSVSDVGPPPPGCARSNRLNDEKVSVFYGASSINTALVEVGATEGEMIQMAAFRLKAGEKLQLGLIGEFHRAERTGLSQLGTAQQAGRLRTHLQRLGENVGQYVQFIDAFLACLLSDPRAGDTDYIVSRAIGRMFYRCAPQAEGVCYPSVKDNTGFNIALKPEVFRQKLAPVACIHARVLRIREFGFFSVKNLEYATSCSAAGEFAWMAARSDNEYALFNQSNQEFKNLEAWNAIRGQPM